MGLIFYYKFEVPAETSASQLEQFLRRVEVKAREMKFDPTLVLNAPFDSSERRVFARRLGYGFDVEDERLKDAVLPLNPPVWIYSRSQGSARLIPTMGVFLVVTDEQRCETFFGFFRYPEIVKDASDRIVAISPLNGKWHFQDWVGSRLPRGRERRFPPKLIDHHNN
jgi:hypothetical protein